MGDDTKGKMSNKGEKGETEHEKEEGNILRHVGKEKIGLMERYGNREEREYKMAKGGEEEIKEKIEEENKKQEGKNEYYVEFPEEEQEVREEKKEVEEYRGMMVQFVGKLSEAFRYLNLKRAMEGMEEEEESEWRRRKIECMMKGKKEEGKREEKKIRK